MTFKFCFLQEIRVPNFYFANLEFWQACRASGLPQIKKLDKTKISKNLIEGGVPSTKNTPILTFDFTLKAPWGSRGPSYQKDAKNKESPTSNIRRGPYYKKLAGVPSFAKCILKTPEESKPAA